MDPRTRRKQRELEFRRQEILRAAEGLFSQQGFFKTSMADIAAQAQFAMGTVYRMFTSKEDIYISLVEAKVEELMELIQHRLAEHTTAAEKLNAFIRVKLEYADQNRDFFRIYVSEWSGFEWTIKSAFGERVWKWYIAQVDLVADLIAEGTRQGEFRDVPPRDTALALHGMLNSTMYNWILQPHHTDSLLAKGDLIETLLFHGLLSRRTRGRQTRRKS